ncbi:MAG: heparinase II/III family protein, partial [Bacteroidales bacterium]|nr:heparinase II/III family protein [Bacteroidales bacterium]MCF0168298.1 heparinase II/III family protein [Bacteroidales bacterium]
KEIIEDAVKNNAPALIPMYSPDGNYPEGYGYWGYGTSFQVIMLSAFETVFGHCHGLDITPGFERTAQFEMNMASTSSPSAFNFSDSSGDVSPQYCSWWFAAHFNDQSLLLMDRHLLQNGKYRGGESRLACFAPVWALHLKKGESSVPEYKVWSGMGNNPVVLIHTLWDFSENDKYLAFKGGQAYESHAHMDAGSFVYDAYNCRWAEDLGSENYARTERLMGELHGSYWDLSQESMRWDVFRCSNFAHNTLTINGQKHVTDGKSTIEEVFSEPALQGGRINLDPVFEGDAAAVCREFRLIDNSVLQITDKVTALDSLEARIQWRMVTPAAVEVTPDGITLTQKGKKITIKTACDDEQIPDYFSEPAWGNRVFDSKNEGHTVVGFTVLVKASKTLTFTTTIE